MENRRPVEFNKRRSRALQRGTGWGHPAGQQPGRAGPGGPGGHQAYHDPSTIPSGKEGQGLWGCSSRSRSEAAGESAGWLPLTLEKLGQLCLLLSLGWRGIVCCCTMRWRSRIRPSLLYALLCAAPRASIKQQRGKTNRRCHGRQRALHD